MKVKLSKSAKKDIKKLDKDIRNRVYKEIRLLRQRVTGMTRLKGHKDRGKIKVGDYRVLYEIDRKNKIANVTEVILRKDAYRDL
jgi:mRNA interferase RelE/StbE